jgi:hypothetical protein
MIDSAEGLDPDRHRGHSCQTSEIKNLDSCARRVDHLRKEWDRLYSIRSGIFHGTARLSAPEISQAAFDTITLCGRIILALVIKEGARVPPIAATNFSDPAIVHA